MSGPPSESASRPRSNGASPAERLRNAVAELNDLVLFDDLDAAAAEALAGRVEELTRSYQAASCPKPRAGDRESWGDYRRRSPFAGIANPRAPGLRMRIDSEADVPTAQGQVTVSAAFAGPPGYVHGGIIAGLLDEAIGWLASATVPDAVVVTGKLSVRFRAPTPVARPLDLQVSVTRQTSRSLTMQAVVACDDVPTASGEALMVLRR